MDNEQSDPDGQVGQGPVHVDDIREDSPLSTSLEAKEIDPRRKELIHKVEQVFEEQLKARLREEGLWREIMERRIPHGASNSYGFVMDILLQEKIHSPSQFTFQNIILSGNKATGPMGPDPNGLDLPLNKHGPRGLYVSTGAGSYAGNLLDPIDPEESLKYILEVCGEDRSLETIMDEATLFSDYIGLRTVMGSLYWVNIGDGAFLSFWVNSVYVFDEEIGEGKYVNNIHYSASSLSMQLGVRTKNDKVIPAFLNVVARAVEAVRKEKEDNKVQF